jgi:hypothetical protein
MASFVARGLDSSLLVLTVGFDGCREERRRKEAVAKTVKFTCQAW